MVLQDPQTPVGRRSDGIVSHRGLETHRFPRAVLVNGYDLGGQLSPGSGEGQSSGTIDQQLLAIWSETEAGVQSTAGAAGPLADDRCARSRTQRRAWLAGSSPARPTRLQLGVGLTRSAPSSRHELLSVKQGPPLQHVVGGAADLVGEDGQSLPLSVLSLELLQEGLALGVLPEEQDGGLGEGPLQVDVADLLAPRPELLAGGLLRALDQAGVGGEVLDGGEALDVVDLVEDCQGEDLADAREGAEPVEGGGVVLTRVAGDVQLEVSDDPIVGVDEGEVGLDALADGGVGEGGGDAGAVGSIDEVAGGLGEVALVVGVLDVSEQLSALADEVESAAEQIASGAQFGRVRRRPGGSCRRAGGWRSSGRRCGRSWPCLHGWPSCRERGPGRRGSPRQSTGQRASTR